MPPVSTNRSLGSRALSPDPPALPNSARIRAAALQRRIQTCDPGYSGLIIDNLDQDVRPTLREVRATEHSQYGEIGRQPQAGTPLAVVRGRATSR